MVSLRLFNLVNLSSPSPSPPSLPSTTASCGLRTIPGISWSLCLAFSYSPTLGPGGSTEPGKEGRPGEQGLHVVQSLRAALGLVPTYPALRLAL